jgi:hypothetical protein
VIAALRAHVRTLWPRGALWPIAPFVAYAVWSYARADLRVEHLVIAIVALLAYVGPRTKELLLGIYPLGLVFIIYDGMRPWQRVGLDESRVLLCSLRALEARLFGAAGNTPHDYFQSHHFAALDVLCAIPYATFVLWCLAGAIWLYMNDRAAMRRFMWGFFALNVAGFVTYHLLPAAPPWYFHAHGCTVDLATTPNEGPALARVDQLLGIPYFHGMYAKGSSVFGALPSLHCAYPFLLVIEGWRSSGTRLRAVALAYYLWMVFSAVYLDHHWILDALLGTAYAVGIAGAMRLIVRFRDAEGPLPRLPESAP